MVASEVALDILVTTGDITMRRKKKPSAIETERLQTAVKEKQRFYREKMIAEVNFDKIYNDFE
ncbi:MAG: hypothetical protein WAL97_10095 [Halobacteriota archaeon]